MHLLLATFADHAHQALGHDAVQGGNEVIGFDAHVDETADHVGHVVGVHRGEHQVAGERGIDGDLRGFLVADFADHDLVRVMAQNRTQAARKRQALFFVYRNLGDAADLIFDRVFNGDDLVFVVLDFVDGRVERGGFARAGGAGDQHHAVGFLNVTAEANLVGPVEADHVERQVPKFFAERLFVQHAKHGVLAVHRRHDRHAEVDEAPFVANPKTAVLRNPAFGDIQFAHDLDARKNGGVPFLGQRLHGVLQHAVNAVLHHHFGAAGLDVNVTRAAFECGENHGIDQPDHRAHAGIAREFVHRDVFVAVFVVVDHLQGEAFGGLVQHPLGLLGALQQIVDLRSSGDFDLQLLAQQQCQFVGEVQLTGVGHGDHQSVFARFHRHEFVTEHQFGGNTAEKIRVNPLLAQVHEGAAIAFGQFLGLIAFDVAGNGRNRRHDRIVGGCSHRVLTPGADLKGKQRQVKRYQNEAYHNGHDHQNRRRHPDQRALQSGADFLFVEFGDAGQHGGERSRCFTDFYHFQGHRRYQVSFLQAFVQGLPFPYASGRTLDRGRNQAAVDGLGRGFQARHQRRSTRQKRRQSTNELSDLALQPDIAHHRHLRFQAIDGQRTLVGPGPNVNRRRHRGG